MGRAATMTLWRVKIKPPVELVVTDLAKIFRIDMILLLEKKYMDICTYLAETILYNRVNMKTRFFIRQNESQQHR